MDTLLQDTIEIVKAAGAAIMNYYDSSYEVREKSPGNPVTDADIAANELLRARLTDLLPEAGWLSEESVSELERLMKKLIWVVDPLDGTKEFIAGRPEFVVSVGLAELGQPRLGVVYNPATEELFYAERGQGVYYNNKPVSVSDQTQLEGAHAVLSRTDTAAGEFESLDDLFELETVGSTAYRMARVAAGMADATWTRHQREEWDVCAGVMLVQEAGGRCADLNDKAITFNHHKTDVQGVVADNGHLHEQVMGALAELSD